MTKREYGLLVALAAIWGGSFIFMRVLSPIFGPIWTASMRLFIAGVFLQAVFLFKGYAIGWRQHWKQYTVIGLINSSMPFFFYAYAALYLPASISVVLNALSPTFGALIAFSVGLESFSIKKIAGLMLGLVGVMIISLSTYNGDGGQWLVPIGACLSAALCYGISSVYIKTKAKHLNAQSMACASQVIAGLLLMPLGVFFPVRSAFGFYEVVVLVVFAILCSALAYLIYYHLLTQVGPTKTLTVTYLMPLFGILWGVLLLGETITLTFMAGGLVILLGTVLVTRAGVKAR